jgi:hypothetical protein
MNINDPIILSKINQDISALMIRRLKPEQVKDEIFKTINAAIIKYFEKIQSPVPTTVDAYGLLKFDQAIEGDSTFQINDEIEVTLHSRPSNISRRCEFFDCQHVTIDPRKFTIKNVQTNARIFFNDISLHLLKHNYFGGYSSPRIDPTLTARDIFKIKGVQPDVTPSTSQEDIDALKAIGLEPKQVAEAFYDIIQKAMRIYLEKYPQEFMDNNVAVKVTEFAYAKGNNEVFVDENNEIKVTLPEYHAAMRLNCRFCDHITNSPRTYTIENVNAIAKICFDDHSLHELWRHYYFGDSIRIDPVLTAREIVKLSG